MGRVNSLAHAVYGGNPDEWDEDLWIERVGQLDYVLQVKSDLVAAGVSKAIAAAFGKR